MPKDPYPYEVHGKLVTGNGFLIPICSLSNRSLLPSLTVFGKCLRKFSSNPRNVKVQSDFVKYLTPMHCVLPFLPFPSQQPGLSALNRKKPGKGRPQKKEGHG